MIFSSALVDAYKLESKNAIYPRILIHESVVRKLTHDADLSGLNAVVKQDADGLAFLDYLEYISECDDFDGMYEYMKRHKESVLQNINGPLSPEVKQKYLWVARYHNQKVSESFSDEEYQARQNHEPIFSLTLYEEFLKKCRFSIYIKENCL